MKFLCRKSVAGGVVDGKLKPCPPSPNCVCSHESDAGHRIEPLPFTGPAADAFQKLAVLLEQRPRTKLITQAETYIHAEVTTRIMRYVDDVEFLLDADANLIHMRSASRLGHSDLGANRNRLEDIRSQFTS